MYAGAYSRKKKVSGEMPIYKQCSRCGKRILAGTNCICQKQYQKQRYKEYDKHARNKERNTFYASVQWERTRAEVLELDEGMDVYLYMTEGKVVAADTVHHITPLADDWQSRLDKDNLMSLSHETHSTIERRYQEEKEQMIKELKEMLAEFRAGSRQGA